MKNSKFNKNFFLSRDETSNKVPWVKRKWSLGITACNKMTHNKSKKMNTII